MSNPIGPCGACGEPVEKVFKEEAISPTSRWQHIDLAVPCRWGHPSRPGVQLRDDSLFDEAADAIADWINGAPCDDPAYARSLVNRLSALQPSGDVKDEPCPDCWQLVAEKQELRDKLRGAYFVVADRQQQVENDERNMRAARRHIELFVENGEWAELTAALAGLDIGSGE